MASLNGQTIASSYEQLLHTDTDGGGNGNTLVSIKDGDNGTTFAIKLATNKVEVLPGSDDANAFEVSQADGTAVFTVNTSSPSATFAGNITQSKAGHLRLTQTATGTGEASLHLHANNSSGDSFIRLQTDSTTFAMGIDNSDGDKFKFAAGSDPHSSPTVFNIQPDGSSMAIDKITSVGEGFVFTGTALSTGHTGIGSSGSGGELRIYTNGTQTTTFASGGNVGIKATPGNDTTLTIENPDTSDNSYIIDGSHTATNANGFGTRFTIVSTASGRDILTLRSGASGSETNKFNFRGDGSLVMAESLYMAGGSAGRLHFNNHRAFEGASNASLVRIGEDYTATNIYGKVGINEASPETTAGLTINQGGNDDKILSLKSTDLAHGVTSIAETDTFGFAHKFSATQGGLVLGGMTTHERPVVLQAYGTAYQSPAVGTGVDKCAFQLFAYENSGTGVTNVGSNESIFAVRCQKGDSMQSIFIVDTEGDLHADGSTSITGYDYAEYFEWTDGNPDNEDRVGYSVVLEGDKIRKATEGETPIGIISGTPAVVGDNPMNWHGTWKTDEWGRKINKEVEWVRWEYDYQSEEGAEVVTKEQNWKVSDLPEDLEIPDNAEYYTDFEAQYSDDYDPSQSYTLREYRQEWSAVGLMGKLRLRKGQPVASTWIKMRDEGNNIEMWLVK